ncbi:MAG: metallophosphoesterase family protein [Gemmatimonadota bacterium]
MRIALIADVHGNPIALDAVLRDAASAGAERFLFLGDHCAIGPEPSAVLERIARLPDAVLTRGNTDRYIVTGDGPPPGVKAVREDPDLIPVFAQIAASFAWTRGHVTATGWLSWLEALPLEIRLEPGGIRMLAVHAAPGTDDGPGIHPGCSDAELGGMMAEADADLLIVGHTHEPLVRRAGDGMVVNVGSVSNPRAPDLRASYLMLEATSAGVELKPRRVAYDHEAFVASVFRSRHPSADFILAHQRGEVGSTAPHADHLPLAAGTTARVGNGVVVVK